MLIYDKSVSKLKYRIRRQVKSVSWIKEWQFLLQCIFLKRKLVLRFLKRFIKWLYSDIKSTLKSASDSNNSKWVDVLMPSSELLTRYQSRCIAHYSNTFFFLPFFLSLDISISVKILFCWTFTTNCCIRTGNLKCGIIQKNTGQLATMQLTCAHFFIWYYISSLTLPSSS